MKKISIVVVLAVFVLSACGTPATPAPTATPTSVPSIEVNFNETLIKIVEINFGKYVGTRVTDNKDDLGALGGYEAEQGFRYAELVIEISQGESTEEVSNWVVTLQDSEGKLYEPVIRGTGVFYGDANNVGWTFHIPENADQLKLIFPEGLSVDLSPLIAK